MDSAYTSEEINVRASKLCYYDTNLAYSADFGRNGDVDGWTYYDGIHSYGCWNNFIFATLYGEFALIGRSEAFLPFSAEDYFMFSLSMKIHIVDRAVGQPTPKVGRVMWKSISDPHWDTKKSADFEIHPDNKWYTYNLNLADAQYWQGDIYDLRIYPILEDGRDGDEFFIRAIQVRSVDLFSCDKKDCEWYQSGRYEHPCQGIGASGYCLSDMTHKEFFTISGTASGDTDLYINIDDYGQEVISLGEFHNYSGKKVARLIEQQLSLISLGGYERAEVEYTDDSRFLIKSGTLRSDSSVYVGFSKAAVELGFYNEAGTSLFTTGTGRDPANLSRRASSFKVSSYGIQSLFDNRQSSAVYFNPFDYNVEAGRRDWLSAGPGKGPTENRFTMTDGELSGNNELGVHRHHTNPSYFYIDGFGKIIIDYCHPFNATGRVKHLHALATLDMGYETVPNPKQGGWPSSEENDVGRITAKGCKFLILRPRKDGTFKCIHVIPIDDKTDPMDTLYDRYQMTVEADCDIFVNKGDFLGIYNVKLYAGPLSDPKNVNALYYMVEGDISEGDVIDPGEINGTGTDGLLMYARSDEKQSRLILEVDLVDRINVENIIIKGEPESPQLEYNLARCLDINWQVDLFGLEHTTGYYNPLAVPPRWFFYDVPNIAYGVNRLYDGIYTVPKGQAAESWGVDITGVVPNNPYYFWVNGDHEWIGRHYFENVFYEFEFVQGFERDPIAFTIMFPFGKRKNIFKSRIYFKEENNFRNFALSYYVDDFYALGNADDPHFNLIPDYTAVTLDKRRYEKNDANYELVDAFLFSNPSISDMNLEYLQGPGMYIPGDSTIPGNPVYFAKFKIENAKAVHQASQLDWKMITHEWEPISAKGFRIYTDYHRSTKITEMEIYGYAPDLGSTLVGGIFVSYSIYKDYWLFSDIYQSDNTTAVAPIGDTPRYLTIDINPILPVNFSDITINVSADDVIIEDLHCTDVMVVGTNGLGEVGEVKEVTFKNYYEHPYDLYVNLLRSTSNNLDLTFYNKFDGYHSLERSDKGPAVKLNKTPDYLLRNVNKNIAINCDCFALDNALIGKKAYYSYDDGMLWQAYDNGDRFTTNKVGFHNLSQGAYSVVNVPIISRSRYWRLALKCGWNTWNIREIRVFYKDEELECVFYHDKDIDVFSGRAQDTAPHLNNKSVSGSYYVLTDRQYITIDLGEPKSIDKMVIYHDAKSDWTPMTNYYGTAYSNRYCGVDRYTTLYLLENKPEDKIIDYSYYENEVVKHGDVRIASSVSTVSGTYLLNLGNITSVREWAAREYSTDNNDYQLQHLTYFDWVPSSGTLVSGTYQYPGYFDFSIEGCSVSWYDTRLQAGIVRPINKDKEFYWGGKWLDDRTCPEIELRCAFEITDLNNNNGSLDIGFTKGQRVHYYSYKGLVGCTVHITSSSTAIWITTPDNNREYFHSSNFGVCQLNTKYYLKFTYDGVNNYALYVWSDDFDGGNLVFSGTCQTNLRWSSEFIGLASYSNINPPNNAVKGKLYHFEVKSNLVTYNALLPGSTGSMQFDGNSWLTLPELDVYELKQRRFTIDLWIKPEELPYLVRDVSGEDHIINYAHMKSIQPSDGLVGWAYRFYDTNAYMEVVDKGEFDFTTDDFTLDCYFKPVVFGATKGTLFYKKDTLHFYYDLINSQLVFEFGSQDKVTGLWQNPDSDEYYHLAVSRAGDQLHLFIDGIEKGTSTISGTLDYNVSFDTLYNYYVDENNSLFIGSSYYNNAPQDPSLCVMEEARVTKGLARWSSNFTPPTGKFIPDEYTKLLVRGQRDYAVIIQQREYDIEEGTSSGDNCFALILKRHTYFRKWTLQWVQKDNIVYDAGTYHMDMFKPHKWVNLIITNDVLIYNADELAWNADGLYYNKGWAYLSGFPFSDGNNDLVVGKYFKGTITNLRFSRTDLDADSDHLRYGRFFENIPLVSNLFGRLYTLSLYISDTNEVYGKYADIDLWYPSQYSYYLPGSLYSFRYYSMFAIDLEKRYDLEFIRNYGDPDVTDVSLTENAVFSNKETDNVYEAFADLEPSDISTSFVDEDYADPKEWTRSYKNGLVCIYDDRLYIMVDGEGEDGDVSSATFNYTFKLDFSVEFDYELALSQFYPWALDFNVYDIINDKVGLIFRISFENSRFEQKVYTKDDETDFVEKWSRSSGVPDRGSVKIERVGHTIKFYTKALLDTVWNKVYEYTYIYKFWTLEGMQFSMKPLSPGYGDADLYISRFTINDGVLFESNPRNARWVMLTLLNGDGQDRLLERVGIYTRISTQLAPSGGYNNSWTSLGPSITMYSAGAENLAFGATVSGTDVSEPMSIFSLVDGIDEFNIYKCWAVDDFYIEPYFIIDFDEVKEIYRVVMKHSAADPDAGNNLATHMIYKYNIDVAETEGNFTTIFSIDNNSSIERIHDLAEPVKARWLRVTVFSYDTEPSLIAKDDDTIVNFVGPVLREIEVYPFYGFSIISSDDYPIIAVNLKDQFYLDGHPVVIGPWEEDDSKDWVSEIENTCYSDSVLSDPQKVYFNTWGSKEGYEQWVVTKNLDATDYKNGERFLKHLVVKAQTPPSLTDYPHWWSAVNCSVSTALDSSYYHCVRALKVDYPASDKLAKVSYIEGDNFGVDDKCSWRDAFVFRWYINDYDAIDWTEGKIVFGGRDGTTTKSPVFYEWYFSSISGSVNTGWNEMFFRLKSADNIVYDEVSMVEVDPRTPNLIEFGSISIEFKGNNTGDVMFEIDGFSIDRNIFEDHLADAVGLYLSNNDSVSFPFSNVNLSSGAISLWIRPDTYFTGIDTYGRVATRNIFIFTSAAGDILGSALTSDGVMIYYGNVGSDKNKFKRVLLDMPNVYDYPIDDPWFFGLAFSNTGKGIDDSGATLKLFINGVEVLSVSDPWEVVDDKYATFVLGGGGSLNALYDMPGEHVAISAVVAHLKLYNYARTDFYKDMYDFTGNVFSSTSTDDLIEISRDNVTFYKVDDSHLPFIFKQVPPGDEVTVYVRSVIPDNMTILKDMSRTVRLLTQWYIGV